MPAGLTTLALGGLVFLFALLKTLTESYRGWASWVGIVLAAAVAVGAWFCLPGQRRVAAEDADGRRARVDPRTAAGADGADGQRSILTHVSVRAARRRSHRESS